MSKWIWWLDGEETNARGVIRAAKLAGYEAVDGVYLVYYAAEYLRRRGHVVEQWETGE
jgi:hypothetical protein